MVFVVQLRKVIRVYLLRTAGLVVALCGHQAGYGIREIEAEAWGEAAPRPIKAVHRLKVQMVESTGPGNNVIEWRLSSELVWCDREGVRRCWQLQASAHLNLHLSYFGPA